MKAVGIITIDVISQMPWFDELPREAVATLASERAANAVLTDEVERLRAAIDRACRTYPTDDVAPTCVVVLRQALNDSLNGARTGA